MPKSKNVRKNRKKFTGDLFRCERVLAKAPLAVQELLTGFKSKLNSRSIALAASGGSARNHGSVGVDKDGNKIAKWVCVGPHRNPARNADRKLYRLARKLGRRKDYRSLEKEI